MLIDVSTNLTLDVGIEQHLEERYNCSPEEKERRRICSRHRRKGSEDSWGSPRYGTLYVQACGSGWIPRVNGSWEGGGGKNQVDRGYPQLGLGVHEGLSGALNSCVWPPRERRLLLPPGGFPICSLSWANPQPGSAWGFSLLTFSH